MRSESAEMARVQARSLMEFSNKVIELGRQGVTDFRGRTNNIARAHNVSRVVRESQRTFFPTAGDSQCSRSERLGVSPRLPGVWESSDSLRRRHHSAGRRTLSQLHISLRQLCSSAQRPRHQPALMCR